MKCPEARSRVRDFQVRGNPIQVRITGQQPIIFIHQLFTAGAIGVHKQFRHCNCRCNRMGTSRLKPGKNRGGHGQIQDIRFHLIYEYIRVQCDQAVPSQEGPKTV